MTWKTHLERLGASGWWGSEEARRVLDKREGKAWARDMGFRTPDILGPHEPCVIKPVGGYGSRGITIVENPGDIIIERLVEDVDGGSPRDFRAYCFHGEPLFLEVARHGDRSSLGTMTECRYYWTDGSWAPADIRRDRPHDGDPIRHASEASLAEILGSAARAAKEFTIPFVRVDFFLSKEFTVLFSELCATPGLVMGGAIRPEWDDHFGRVIERSAE